MINPPDVAPDGNRNGVPGPRIEPICPAAAVYAGTSFVYQRELNSVCARQALHLSDSQPTRNFDPISSRQRSGIDDNIAATGCPDWAFSSSHSSWSISLGSTRHAVGHPGNQWFRNTRNRCLFLKVGRALPTGVASRGSGRRIRPMQRLN